MSQLRRDGRLLAVAAMVTTGLIAVPNALGANQLVAPYAQELVARSTLASAPPALRQSVGAALGPAPATPIAAKITATFSTSGSRLTTTDGSWHLAVGIGWSEDPELTAADGAAGDGFGYSVAVSGTTAIIGAPFSTVGSNPSQGAAYVFTESGGTWSQQPQPLIASDGAASDEFGYSVSVSGNTAIIGAPDHAGTNLDQGAAYVFTESGGTWSQQSELTAPGTSFGWSVSLSGNSALVGAPHQTAGPDANEGIAYLYSEPGASWSPQPQITVLNDPAGVANDLFGWSVSLSGNTAVVGAPVNTTASNGPGAAYVFTASAGTWSENATLTTPDGAPDDLFGYSVSTSGATALVGAQRHAVNSHAAQGAAYVFSASGGTWSPEAELTAADGDTQDLFGHSVSLAGNAALVGAPSHQVGANTSQGAAYVFTGSGETWSQQADLTAADGAPRDQFGFSVSLSGNTAVGGAFGHEVGSSTGQGAAYVFNPSSLVVSVSGSQTSGSSSPTFTYAPAGAGLTGNLTCSTVDGGTAIGPALTGGSYTIDGPSCVGLSSSTGDVISYAGANDGFVVNQSPASPPPPSPPATSATTTTTTTTSTTPSTTTTTVATSGRSGTTTTTTIGPHPRVHLTSPSATAFGVYLHVKLSCEMAACAGAAEVTERALIKTHKGKKTVSGEETIVLAKAPYSLAKGKTSTIKLTQTVAGMVAFADAKAHPRRERLVVSVRGGNTTNVSVLIS